MAAPLETTEITAGRLHLRPWVPYDAEAVHAACQDPLIQRFTSVPSPYAMSDAVTYLQQSAQRWQDGTAATFAVLDATTADLLASVVLFDLNARDRTAEVGYWAVAAARGRGIASEAVGVVCRWGFAALDLHRITCLTVPDNEASQRTALRAGFTYEGIARGRLGRGGGVPQDAWQAALLATD